MPKLITSKRVKITSKGRYQHSNGIILGPTRYWYNEKVETLKELLKKYERVEIVEDVGNGYTVELNLQNVAADNKRKPVNMMESDTEVASPQEKSTMANESKEMLPKESNEEIQEHEKSNIKIVEEKEPVLEQDGDQENVSLNGSKIAETKNPTYQQTTNNKKGKRGKGGNNLAVNPKKP